MPNPALLKIPYRQLSVRAITSSAARLTLSGESRSINTPVNPMLFIRSTSFGFRQPAST
ncbi:Uncharacterised protein [Shigella flexneri]|nr:Uncharacterised protein [Shigella flexneri]